MEKVVRGAVKATGQIFLKRILFLVLFGRSLLVSYIIYSVFFEYNMMCCWGFGVFEVFVGIVGCFFVVNKHFLLVCFCVSFDGWLE